MEEKKRKIKFLGYVLKRSEKEIREKLEEIRKKREGKWEYYGKDGFIEIWRKKFEYRGVPYEIAAMKYFSFNKEDPLKAGLNKIGIHLVLEYCKGWEEVHKLAENLGNVSWLWEDSLHAGQEDWTLEQMEEFLHITAIGDIDWLLDDSIKVINNQIKDLEEMRKKINFIRFKLGEIG